MTIVTILDGVQKDKKKKPIEFIEYRGRGGDRRTDTAPDSWDNILVLPFKIRGYDVFWAYGKVKNDGVLYLGHFNDGVVE